MERDSEMSDLSEEPSQPDEGAPESQKNLVEMPKPSAVLAVPPTPQDSSDDREVEEPNPKESLEPFDWDALEESYHAKMQECQKTEEGIYTDFATWVKV